MNARVAQIAARQLGVVDTDDLHACGLTNKAILSRVRGGLLFPLYRGVYVLAHPNIEFKAWCLAAVKACGPGAALSHWAAAVLWELLEPTGRYPDVIAATVKRHDGINTHRADTFDATTHKGIPVTTPAQTIIHLSAVADFKTLRRAVNEALNRRLDHAARPHHPQPPRREAAARRPRHRRAHALGERERRPAPPARRRHPEAARQPDHPGHRTSSPTSSGPTTRSSSRPTHGATTTTCSPAPTTATKQAVFEALGYRVIRTSWAEITSRPDRMIERVSARLGQVPLHAS